MAEPIIEEADLTALPERRSNRPVTLSHRIEYALTLALIGFFNVIGVTASSFIAGKFMRFTGPLLRPVHKRATTNLQFIFPDIAEKEAALISRDVWENLGRTAAEFAHLEKFRPSASAARVHIEGGDILQRIIDEGAPAIFVSGHFANWEVGSILFHEAGLNYGVIYRAANNPLVDELIIKKRGRVMSRLQIPKGKRGARQMVETLRAGKSLAMLVDQKLNDGICVPFLGRDAMTAPAPARLALKFDAPVIPVSIERMPGARFTVTIREPIKFEKTGDTAADTRALTIRINEVIGEDIIARPGQWLWLHRRWGKDIHLTEDYSAQTPS